jgi:hypothetical protein
MLSFAKSDLALSHIFEGWEVWHVPSLIELMSKTARNGEGRIIIAIAASGWADIQTHFLIISGQLKYSLEDSVKENVRPLLRK